MSDTIATRPGQANLSGDALALFLKMFSGEVLTAFSETNIFAARHTVRTITSGKSSQFPASWKGDASYHIPGQELNGTTVATNERVITVDDLLVADRFIANIDDAMSHYDIRSILSRDIGMALARTYDKQLAALTYLCARGSATVTGGNGGSSVTDANAATVADNLVAAIFSAVQKMDEKDVPQEDRYIVLKPAQYYLLVNGTKVVNRDYATGTPNEGGTIKGTILQVAGVEVLKSNNLPNGLTLATGPSKYQGVFTTSVAPVFHRSAIGTVKLMDLAMEMDYLIKNQGWLMVGKYAMGHDILRPEAAVEIKTA